MEGVVKLSHPFLLDVESPPLLGTSVCDCKQNETSLMCGQLFICRAIV